MSKSNRDLLAAVGFAHGLAECVKNHYVVNKPKIKTIHPILDELIEVSFETLVDFMTKSGTTMKDVKIIEKRISEFEKTGQHQQESYMTICGQVIGQVSERIAILSDKNGDKNKINKLENVLKCLEKLYSYYKQRNNRPDFEQASTEAFLAWEAME